mmetsp:Transcript_10533/g.17672  ORF Transcript_10533/g.17672 Transcript_10533/m.17672 type:complete len:323 (-) Transcript_10533:645-1613(-)
MLSLALLIWGWNGEGALHIRDVLSEHRFYFVLGGLERIGDHLVHAGDELVVGYLAVLVEVDLVEDLTPQLLILLLARLEHHTQLLLGHVPILVLVDHVEGELEVLLVEQLGLVGGRSDELGVVYQAVAVLVERDHNVLEDLQASLHVSEDLLEPLRDLLELEQPIPALIEFVEDFAEALHIREILVLGDKEGHDAGLEDCVLLELVQVEGDVEEYVLPDLLLLNVLEDPGVVEQGLRRAPLLRVAYQHALHEVLGLLARGLPDLGCELDVLRSDLHEHLLLALALEGRLPAQQDVSHHAYGPNIHREVVGQLFYDLGSHVQR